LSAARKRSFSLRPSSRFFSSTWAKAQRVLVHQDVAGPDFIAVDLHAVTLGQ
jgi:hypothetical protein